MSAHSVTPPRGAKSVLGVIFIATLLMSLSSNMLNIAVPALTEAFSASPAESTLVVMAYQLINTALVIPAGQLADSLDRRKVFLGGLAVFALASALMAVSPSITGVIVGRAVQGACAAVLLSNAVAILASVYPRRALAGAMGVYLSGFSIGQVTGPLVGGIIVSTVGWQWLFLLNVPIALTSMIWGIFALRIMPKTIPKKLSLDIPGGLLLAVILLGSQAALSVSAELGLTDPVVLAALGGALLLIPLLLLVERRLENPVLHPEIFRDAAFPVALIHGALVMLPRFGAVTIAGLYFQGIYGDSAALAALKILGFPAALTIGSLSGGRVGKWIGVRLGLISSAALSVAGMAIMLVGTLLMADGLGMVGLGVLGLGNGVFQTLNSSTIMTSTPPERTGVVNSIRVMTQSFAAGVGLALGMSLIMVFASPEVSRSFLAGDPAGLGAAGVASMRQGYALAYGTMLVFMFAGLIVTFWKPRQHDAADR